MTNIRRLQDICIDRIAGNFEHLWTCSKDNQYNVYKIVWCDPGLGLPYDISEKLLCKLSEQWKLNDGTLSLFQPENACLRHITIPEASNITKKGLKTLASHRLLSLDICNSFMTLTDVLTCLGSHNWASLKNLRCEDLKWMTLCLESLSESSTRFFPRLDSVRCLSLIHLRLTDNCLDVIASNVPNLQSLDISHNFNITNISPLQKHTEQLQELIMNGLYQLTEVDTVDTLRKLKQLRHLGVNVNRTSIFHSTFQLSSLLMDPSTNPNLTSLDLCGRDEVTEEMLKAFLDAHPSLTFLGLLYNKASDYPMFDAKSPQYRPGIKVAGTSNLDQMALSLRRYTDKSRPIPRILSDVLDELDHTEPSFNTTDNDDIIRGILELTTDEMWIKYFTIYYTKKCLNGLEKILMCRCISHIQPDTIRQLLRTCHLVLKQCEALPLQQTILKEDRKKQAERIMHICENLKTD